MDPQRRASSVGVALADGLCTPSQYAPMRNTVRHRAFRRVAAELADNGAADAAAPGIGAADAATTGGCQREWRQRGR